ncbi:MAG TPA: pyridoxamine 5'-phosphate oxidase family protein [Ideonella sp.]|nr:pyridoxamine 5'-phosphate oxidase family protein [Ideonella sp.]
MSHAFADIAFTPTVRRLQTQHGSRAAYARLDQGEPTRHALTADEVDFIEARDGFHQATVSETGWPYVQFRGGPAGFLKVRDAHTIAYADFRGNRQYISAGNLATDDRVALILMDQAQQRRLKILGRARRVSLEEDPALVAALQVPGYKAQADGAVVISVEGYDWNCPQHITPRFTEAEINQAVQPLRDELERLKAEVSRLKGLAR